MTEQSSDNQVPDNAGQETAIGADMTSTSVGSATAENSSAETSSAETSSVANGAHVAERMGKIVDVSGAGAVAVMDAEARAKALTGGEGGGAIIGQIGSIVKIKVENTWAYASVRSIRSKGMSGADAFGDEGDLLYVEMDFLGESEEKRDGTVAVRRGISRFPVPGMTVMTTDDKDLDLIFSSRGLPHVPIGTVYPTHNVQANLLIDPLLSKHFAILGSTGTGKSCTVALVIHRIVEALPYGHVVILDPHNEYQDAFATNGVHFDTENLKLPYWMMNLEEHIQVFIGSNREDREVDADILKRCLLIARKKNVNRAEVDRITVDAPVPYRIADLLFELDAAMGKLEKPETLMPFMRLKNKIEELKNDRRYGFMFSGLLVNDNLAETVTRLLRFPSMEKPVSTLDLSGVPSDIVDVVVSVLCRMVFDFAVWSRKETSQPLLLICEEAHRYVSGSQENRNHSARKALETIAKEGRKYGVSLGLVSQRPSELSESVLSQCGTILSMRMNNDKDRKFVESAMPEGSTGFLESLPSLRNQECIICGEGVTAPVRVRLDDLAEEKRPSSDDPNFSASWKHETADTEFVTQVIRRWRSQIR